MRFHWFPPLACLLFTAPLSADEDPLYRIEPTVATQGFDGKQCWVHARAGIIPAGRPGNPGPDPLAVMTLQKLELSGSDVFHPLHTMRSADLGKTWTAPVEAPVFSREPFSWGGRDDLEITVCDFWPKWHAASGKLLGTGHTVVYENNAVAKVGPRSTPYSVYDPASGQWTPWKTLALPGDPKFENAGAGCVQRFDLEDGTVLLPIYYKTPDALAYSVTVLRCAFDGDELRYLGHGSEMTVPVKRGLCEPSLIRHQGRFFLTMRNDDHGYISASDDGQRFSEPVKWCFDDGEDLGSYNTQQHWVGHSDGPFLVYTRRGANNDHVMRHRAPLFIARVDPATLRVVRASEQVLVPEHGARLGNFGVTEVSADETWVTVTEWMQAPGPNYHDPTPLVARGADNRVWVSKLKWNKPNLEFPAP
ncbi:MAG TPA: sialidase family protein [Bacteroidia bacterium]|nr:sialidase family protein [Bacteroidia bacterium]